MEQCLRKLFVNGTTFYMKLELFVFKFTYMIKKIGKKDFSSRYHFSSAREQFVLVKLTRF